MRQRKRWIVVALSWNRDISVHKERYHFSQSQTFKRYHLTASKLKYFAYASRVNQWWSRAPFYDGLLAAVFFYFFFFLFFLCQIFVYFFIFYWEKDEREKLLTKHRNNNDNKIYVEAHTKRTKERKKFENSIVTNNIIIVLFACVNAIRFHLNFKLGCLSSLSRFHLWFLLLLMFTVSVVVEVTVVKIEI